MHPEGRRKVFRASQFAQVAPILYADYRAKKAQGVRRLCTGHVTSGVNSKILVGQTKDEGLHRPCSGLL